MALFYPTTTLVSPKRLHIGCEDVHVLDGWSPRSPAAEIEECGALGKVFGPFGSQKDGLVYLKFLGPLVSSFEPKTSKTW